MGRYTVVLLFPILFGGVLLQNDDKDDCRCVIYYLCRNNGTLQGTIITDGEGLITERIGVSVKCKQGEACCKFVNETISLKQPTITTPEPNITTLVTSNRFKSKGCGFVNPDGVGYKIANSNNAESEFGEYPWMVGIITESGVYRCGGSLIHPSVVLTAAHCVTAKRNYVVRAGEWDSSSTSEVLKHQNRQVSSIEIHEDYKPGVYYNDVALLMLKSPFRLNPHINIACLPPRETIVDNGRCFVTGWGRRKFGIEDEYPPIMKEVQVPMVTKSKCQELLRKTRVGPYFQLHQSFVCAGGEEGKDACIGDGGGPLVCPIPGKDDRYQQVGVVSWGIECNEKDVPGVYADVAQLSQWIDTKMKDNSFNTTIYRY